MRRREASLPAALMEGVGPRGASKLSSRQWVPSFTGLITLRLSGPSTSTSITLPCLYKPSPEVIATAHRLVRLQHADEVQITDPRLGSSLQLLGVPGENLKEIIGRLSNSSHCPISPLLLTRRLEELHDQLRQLSRLTLDVIERFAQGVYGLRGSAVPPGLAESLAPRRSKSKLIRDYGWKDDGRIEVCYRLSKAVLSNGIVSIPAGIRQYVQGRFKLKTADGVEVGNLVAKDTSAWGLGPFFRRRGGEPGDLLTIRFDLKQRFAVVELGDELSDDSNAPVGVGQPDSTAEG